MLVVIGGLAVIDALGRPIAQAAMPVRAVGVTLDPGPGGEAQAYHLFLRAGANEADVYFSAHPSQLPAFLGFAHVEISQLRRLLPWAKVGVTVTYNGLAGDHPQVARTLARLGNATIVTYYPLAGGYRVRSPRSPLRDIPRMIRLSHGRKLVLQEAGYPSTTRLGSSPSAQAAFVRNVFTAWARARRSIPFLSFYSLFDPPARDCATHSGQTAFLCSLGLRDRDGRPKPAWRAFQAGARGVR